MSVHPNSLASHSEVKKGVSAQRRADILAVIGSGYLTDREICRALGFTDMNAVRPRITELIDAGQLYECGSQYDPTTQRRVRLVRCVQEQSEMILQST